ncbi:MAG TPA: hypothetical protein PLV61_05925 [Parvularculaceae bacterium]|nr:hypothetical protein [Parvularculaceae bacterium]HRX38782.1 hypothetical protein [Parvularculaceae bacterium]
MTAPTISLPRAKAFFRDCTALHDESRVNTYTRALQEGGVIPVGAGSRPPDLRPSHVAAIMVALAAAKRAADAAEKVRFLFRPKACAGGALTMFDGSKPDPERIAHIRDEIGNFAEFIEPRSMRGTFPEAFDALVDVEISSGKLSAFRRKDGGLFVHVIEPDARIKITFGDLQRTAVIEFQNVVRSVGETDPYGFEERITRYTLWQLIKLAEFFRNA